MVSIFFTPYLRKWSNSTRICCNGLKPATRESCEHDALGVEPCVAWTWDLLLKYSNPVGRCYVFGDHTQRKDGFPAAVSFWTSELVHIIYYAELRREGVKKGALSAAPKKKLGGGLKYFSLLPLFGEDYHVDWYVSTGLKPPTRKVIRTFVDAKWGTLLANLLPQCCYEHRFTFMVEVTWFDFLACWWFVLEFFIWHILPFLFAGVVQ